VTATDAAGNKSGVATASAMTDQIRPEVAISGAPATITGTASFVATMTFTEDVTGFDAVDIRVTNARLISLSGGPRAYTASVQANGTGSVEIVVPADVAIDLAGNGNLASNAVMIADRTVADTQTSIAGFMQSRANQLLGNQPDLIPFMTGEGAGSFDVNVTRSAGKFNFVSAAGQPIWMRLNGSWSDDAGAETRYVFGAIGSHTNLTPNLMLGAMTQFDYVKQVKEAVDIEGTGWLAGPYVIARSADHPLYFEGRILYGQTDNKISPFGTYVDRFQTDRWLAQAKVAGQVLQGTTTFTPYLDLSLTADQQWSYEDGLGNTIPDQTIQLGQLSLGIDFSHPVALPGGALTVTGGLSGIWSHTSGTGTAASVVPAYDGGRAKVAFGLSYAADDGSQITFSTYYDGIGSDSYESYGVALGYEISF
jgi:hypothetical protein